MKKTTALLGGAAVLALGSLAHAAPVYLNTDHDGRVGIGNTSVWSQVSLKADTTTIQHDTNGDGVLSVGDKFTDSGNAVWDSYLFVSPAAQFDQGLGDFGTGYEVTVRWSGLKGTTTKVDPLGPITNTNTAYTAGTFDFYFDNLVDFTKAHFGNTTGSGDDVNVGGGAGDGVKFMTITLTYGTGANTFTGGIFTSGSSQIYGQITSLLPGYVFTDSGVDLNNYVTLGWSFGDVAQNTQQSGIVFTPLGGRDLFQIDSRHDGSMRLSPVPEPGTMLLLGSGLLSLAGYGRKRSKKA